MTHIATDAVRDAARGQWLSILGFLVPGIGPAIQKLGRHVPCPVHGGRDGFRLYRDAAETGGGVCNSCGEWSDGFAVLMWYHGWTFPEAKQAVADYLRLDTGTDRLPPPRRRERPVVQETSPEDVQKRHDRLLDVWKGTKPDDGTIDGYLRSRGLFLKTTSELRLHPNLPYHDQEGKLVGHFPAMIARVQTVDGTRVSIHRTYLQPDGAGKAHVESPKKLMTPIRDGALMGAAIRLTEAGETLALAEGIETALAVREACLLEGFDLPIWSTVTAGGMERVKVPEPVQRVEIYPDNDASGRGQEAAQILAQRLHDEGRDVYVILPPTPGADWLDELNQKGHPAIWEARMKAQPWTPPPPEPKEPVRDQRPPEQPRHSGRFADRKPPIKTGYDLRNEPPTRYLVDKYITDNGMVVGWGQPACGKSFLFLGMSLSIAAGLPWFGKPVRQGRVIYLAAEGKQGLLPRIEAWGVDRSVPDPLGLPVTYWTEPVQLTDKEEVAWFISCVAPLGPVAVIIDTLSRCASGVDENSAKDMTRVIEGADIIKRELNAAVILVHHSGKSGTSERGSGTLRGAADVMLSLVKEDENLLFSVEKMKDDDPPDPMKLRLIPVLKSNSCVIGRADTARTDGKLSPDQRKALRQLKELGGSASLNRWREMADVKLNQIMPVVNALVDKGYVDAPEPGSKGGKYSITSAGYGAL